MNTKSSFKLVSEISPEQDSSCIIPVKKYRSTSTGMCFYSCKINAPVVEGYFSLATEALDDDGLPHTLEHMIFLGSEEYPYSGVLDLLANKMYAAGTNAWTDVDNTTYTISTAEKFGFLQLLPIYLDHIFYPLLNESGFITEVYHINGEAKDSGVVYSEMQSHENEDETVVERATLKLLYPDVDCGYRYDTGGALKNLRESCSHKKVCEYHKKMYKPNNIAIVVAGDIDSQEVIKVLENFEAKMLSKNRDNLTLDAKPFARPISILDRHTEQIVSFPVDDESSANGIVSLSWHGPYISNLREIVALDLVLNFLSNSSISALHSHFIDKQSYCNKLSYKIVEYSLCYINFSFINVQLNSLDKIKDDFFTILTDIVNKKTSFDMTRLRNIIKMKISEIQDKYINKYEDSPHETISHMCIGDFLYGNPENQFEFKSRFCQIKIFEDLKNENESYWLELINKYILKSFCVTVIGKPSEELMKSIADQDKIRVEERKKELGKKGLKELQKAVDNAQAKNDDFELPDEIYEILQVPKLDKVKFKNLTQHFSYGSQAEKAFEPVESGFKNFQDLQHLQIQVDHLEGTNFVQLYLMIDTLKVSKHLRPYLLLLINILFELPVKNSEIELTHEQVVYELNKNLLEYESSIGLHGSEFDQGSFSQYLFAFVKTTIEDYESAVKWMKLVIFDSVFDKSRIKIAIMNMLKEIKKRRQQPGDIIECISNYLYFNKDSNMCSNDLLKQEIFLNEILNSINADLSSENRVEVQSNLENLKSELLQDTNLRFYLCTDLTKLHATNSRAMDSIWLEYFPSSLMHNNTRFLVSNKPYDTKFTWNFKKGLDESVRKIYSPSPKQDFIVKLGSTESSYLRLLSSTDINSYKHANYAGLLVLIEYFTQTEGPLWEAVRGPGYAYHQSIHVNPDKATIEISLDECSNLIKAYQSTKKLFVEYMENPDNYDDQMLESAKNSLIFMLIDDIKSVSSFSSYSLSCLFKNIELDSVSSLIKKIELVEMDSLNDLLETYIMPLFDPEFSNSLVVSNSATCDTIKKEFNEKFGRNPIVIDKVDDIFTAKN